MHARLRNSIFKLLDSKREVERELVYNKLSHGDMCKMATITKDMRLPLHGIGLSQVIKSELLKEMSDPFENKEPKEMDKKRELLVIVEEMRIVSLELSKTCVSTLSDCSDTILKYSVSPRSWKSTIFWPFPRISLSRFKNKTDDLNLETCQHLAQRLENDIARFEEKSKHTSYMLSNLSIKEYQEQFEGPVQNILLFHFSILEFANKLHSLVKFIEEIDTTRKTCRVWFPKLSFRKWFRSNGMNPTVGVNLSSGSADPGRSAKNTGSFDMTVSQTMVETGSREFSDDTDLVGSCDQRGIIYPRDPDVNPPETILERFFYHVYRIFKWCQSMEVVFSLKCSAGFVLLSLMALLPQSANWFFQWQGAWSTNSQMTWMIPLAGMFFTT
jgi:hypothetical protein